MHLLLFCRARFPILQGNLTFLETGHITFYIGCNGCNKTVNSVQGVHFQCLHCGNKNGVTSKRFGLGVNISDATSVLDTTLFTNEVFKLLHVLQIYETPDRVDCGQLIIKSKPSLSQLHLN
ncbi:unnamed protein product [Cuscuta europaea]|uniref:Replication factor A C-terminal domain-containing protein n=1 Tax=Cuscuta europaea TaxID=41803 RepID=A0A9P0Z722_CUSEU|nr:unnamed protein product [Cuscuta europaea]